ncbi:MAG TPA: phospholipase D family protein [Candidatus Nanoarchaeia archaeon]|nr:phospholipase D family protein [Candidatus Nanoarchaeia archaeon]
MQVSFLGQGLQEEGISVGSMLKESFQNPAFHSFTALAAFASVSGVRLLRERIEESKAHITGWKVFVGIDQKGTSKESLEELLTLDINTYIYFTVTKIIFHPKIYLFEGEKESKVIIGSSNLTERGLFNNVEASIVVDIKQPDEEGSLLIKQIKEYFSDLLNGTDTNVQLLTQNIINKLSATKIIPNEKERRKIYEKEQEEQRVAQHGSLSEIKQLFPSIKIQKSPPRPPVTREEEKAITLSPERGDLWRRKGQLLWKKPKLKKSDVMREGSKKTHVTGELRFTQAGFKVNNKVINQTTYFRYDVFGDKLWTVVKKKPIVDATTVSFRIRLIREDLGEHDLEVQNKPSGEAGQGNFTTSLRWGDLAAIIKKKNLVGKDFYLYAPQQGDDEPFFIEIV